MTKPPTIQREWVLYNRHSIVVKDMKVSPRVKAWLKRVKMLFGEQEDGLAGNIINLENLPMHTELLKLALEGAIIQLDQKYEGMDIKWTEEDEPTPYIVIGEE